MIGIVSYGFYIPKNRIKSEEISKIWNKKKVVCPVGIKEKAIASSDEDPLTMAYEASIMALDKFRESKEKITLVIFGSETHPYAVNPSSTILADFLNLNSYYLAYDTEFACKAATSGLISASSYIKSHQDNYALVIGSDKATGEPNDPLEYSAASGAVAFILGDKDVSLEIIAHSTFSSDTPDFWRREGQLFPSHAGRFTGLPAYFDHISKSTKRLLKKTGLSPDKFKYGVFHMPNCKFPKRIALQLGFTLAQIEQSLIVSYLGNSYTASSLLGLIAVLEKAKPDDLIFLASYGSGAGSDAFVLRVTKNIEKVRRNFSNEVRDKTYIDYMSYLRNMEIF